MTPEKALENLTNLANAAIRAGLTDLNGAVEIKQSIDFLTSINAAYNEAVCKIGELENQKQAS